MTDREALEAILELGGKGMSFCLATVIRTQGSTPREAGAKMLVLADGSIRGSVGGGCGEAKVKTVAMRCLVETGQPQLVTVDLTDDQAVPGGAVCGGRMLVFVEPMGPGQAITSSAHGEPSSGGNA